jgi:prolipoprotein diacylglyceryltransferase
MVYIFVFCGFMMGFGVGLGTLNVMLRYKSKEEIQNDNSLKKYGVIAWALAILGGFIGYWIFSHYFQL